MGRESIGILVFVLISLISAISFHRMSRKFLLSSLLAALTASISFQIIGFFVLGYLDPFFFIAFFFSLIISFIVSLLVGLLLVYYRKKANKKTPCQETGLR